MDDGEVELTAGQIHVVPSGVFRQPVSDKGAEVMLFEPASTLNTGDTPGELTARRLVV